MKKLLLLTGILATLSFSASYAQQDAAAQTKGIENPHRMAVAKTERMARELELSDEQKKAVMQINMHEAEKMKTESAKGDAGKAEMDRAEKEIDARFKVILNEKQYTKYHEMKRRNMEKKGDKKDKKADVVTPADERQ